MWSWHEGWMVFGVMWMLLFWGGLIVLIVWGIKKLTERRGSSTTTTEKHDPLDIARERYARGDISKEEFEQMKKELS